MGKQTTAAILAAVLVLCAVIIGYFAFSITSDIQVDASTGLTIFLTVAFVGAGALIVGFLVLMRRQHRQDRKQR
jgi:protein-S-isoprenylcysteine O-methyltransferase Ste14